MITLLKICQISEIKLNAGILLTIRIKVKQSEPIKPFSVVSHLLVPELPQKARNLYSLPSYLILMTKILELWEQAMCQLVLCIIIFKKRKKIAKRQLKLCPFK